MGGGPAGSNYDDDDLRQMEGAISRSLSLIAYDLVTILMPLSFRLIHTQTQTQMHKI